MAAIPELEQPLSDGVISLRTSAERDIPEILIAYEDDRHLHERMGQRRPPSGADLGSRSERAAGERTAGTQTQLTVTQVGDDTCIGQLTVHAIDWVQSRAELAIWIAPAGRGQGYGAAALRLLAGWLFSHWGMRRLSLLTEPANAPMLAAAAKAGFTNEGVLRGHALERGGRVDKVRLSLLAGDGEA